MLIYANLPFNRMDISLNNQIQSMYLVLYWWQFGILALNVGSKARIPGLWSILGYFYFLCYFGGSI